MDFYKTKIVFFFNFSFVFSITSIRVLQRVVMMKDSWYISSNFVGHGQIHENKQRNFLMVINVFFLL